MHAFSRSLAPMVASIAKQCAMIVVISATLFVPRLQSQTGGSIQEVATFVGHFNFDEYRDTVFGEDKSGSYFLPTRILWGRSATSQGRALETTFSYPTWNR